MFSDNGLAVRNYFQPNLKTFLLIGHTIWENSLVQMRKSYIFRSTQFFPAIRMGIIAKGEARSPAILQLSKKSFRL
jgi:hypothetical protein